MNKKVLALIPVLAIIAIIAVQLHLQQQSVEETLNVRLEEVYDVNYNFYQGLSFYNGLWYFSDREYIAATKSLNGTAILENKLPISYDLYKEGYDHIGDIDVEGGVVYAPLEDKDYSKPLVVLYDADTLKLIGTIGPLEQRHMPWCAVDPGNGLIYSSEFSDVNEIYVYNMKGEKVRVIRLNATLQRVQGGDLEGKYLYLTTDDGGDWIYRVNIESGEVARVAAIKAPYEMEGVEVHEGTLYALVGTPRWMKNKVYVFILYSSG